MKYCGYCGTVAEDEFAFCPKCGKQFPPELFCCPSCNRELPKDSSFCPYCGTQIQQSDVNNVSSKSYMSEKTYTTRSNEQLKNGKPANLSMFISALIKFGKTHMMADYNWVYFGYESVPTRRSSFNLFGSGKKLKKEIFLFRELLGMAIGIGIDQLSKKFVFDRNKLVVAIVETIFYDEELLEILSLNDLSEKQFLINIIADYAHYSELPYDAFTKHTIASLAVPANDNLIEGGKYLETHFKIDFIKISRGLTEKVTTVIDDL